MSFAVRINISSDTHVVQVLSRLSLVDEVRHDMLDQIGAAIVQRTRQRFEQQVSPDGRAWQPSLRTKAQGGQTLNDSGQLINSLTHIVSGNKVAVTTNVPYAPFLHFGAHIRAVASPYLTFKIPGWGWVRKKAVTLPARPFLGLDAQDEQHVSDIVNRFLNPS